jgi:hypothetical protein
MYRRKSWKSRKVYIAVALLVVLVVAIAAAVYAVENLMNQPVGVGVKIGDTFSYTLTGSAELTSVDAVIPTGFSDFNNTDYFQVTVTGINGSTVTLVTNWQFKNGTNVAKNQMVDLSTGNESDSTGFWAIFASNLNPNDLLRPKSQSNAIVNTTSTVTFSSGDRQANSFQYQNQLYDSNDPTHNTMRLDIINVNFDRKTGMLDNLVEIQGYNNPGMNLYISWQLENCSVWTV